MKINSMKEQFMDWLGYNNYEDEWATFTQKEKEGIAEKFNKELIRI